jgi:signal transduction histidine kinase
VALQRPLDRLKQAVDEFADGEPWRRLPESGPQEIGHLIRAFNLLVDRLHSLEAARKQLLANLVHELGRPLGALQSAVQALGGGADQDAALRLDLLAGMEDEIRRLTRLLDDLTGLHDQVVGTLELNRRETALNGWLPKVLAPWQAAAQHAGLSWHSELAPDLPVLLVDSDRLGQAVGNLLSNAIKYTPAGGAVTIGSGFTGDMVWIQVEDSGPGIALEEQQRIFEPFQRGQPGRRFPQGMGLGLTIARDLVLAHGGRLELDSTPGRGSRFTLWLPLRLPPA